MASAVNSLGLLLAVMARFTSCGLAQECVFAEVRCGCPYAVCWEGLGASVPPISGAVGMDLTLQPIQGSTTCLMVGAGPPSSAKFASHLS